MVKKCICQVCGAEFEVANRAGAKYCPECRKTAYKKQKREYNHKERRISEAEKAAAESSSEILRIDREAAKLGMSYGQYVAEERKKAMNKKNEAAPVPKPDIVPALISRALEALEKSEVDCKEVGEARGLLTAAQMILEGDEA
jgi:predicted  nucleic acid-binding Zn-ribbon protein